MILKVRLKELLAKNNMTQKQLSEITSLRPGAVSEIANNMRESINREHIGKIAEALNIKDLNELLYFESR